MPKFVIGIGSQRAGSTLLHRILDECTDIFMHPVKELHYYDTLYGVRDASVLKEYSKRQLNREIERLVDAKEFGYINKRYKCYLRTNKILADSDIEKVDYLDLYRPCIMGNKILGEITPEYMILPEEGVKKMADDLGSDTKIILISRDPVERFVSAYKLLKVYRGDRYVSSQVSDGIKKTLIEMPGWVLQQKKLNDYDGAMVKYKRHFNNVLRVEYENLVERPLDVINLLAAFLDIDIDLQKAKKVASKRVNSIGETGSVTDEVKDLIKSI